MVEVKNIFSLRKIELNKINVVYGFTTSVRRDHRDLRLSQSRAVTVAVTMIRLP